MWGFPDDLSLRNDVADARPCQQRLYPRSGFPLEDLRVGGEQGVQSPADLYARVRAPNALARRNPGPATALRWSGAQPSETVGLRSWIVRPRRVPCSWHAPHDPRRHDQYHGPNRRG